MLYLGFDKICPGIAQEELQRCVVGEGAKHGVPRGVYALLEFYCVDPKCDCRRVLIRFLKMDGNPRVEAVVSYGWESVEYYQKWMRNAETGKEVAGAMLEPLSEQGLDARCFLLMFQEMIKHPRMNEILKRHYALVQGKIRQKAWKRAHPLPRLRGLMWPPTEGETKSDIRDRRIEGGSPP